MQFQEPGRGANSNGVIQGLAGLGAIAAALAFLVKKDDAQLIEEMFTGQIKRSLNSEGSRPVGFGFVVARQQCRAFPELSTQGSVGFECLIEVGIGADGQAQPQTSQVFLQRLHPA